MRPELSTQALQDFVARYNADDRQEREETERFRAFGLLTAHELAERVCSAFGCPHHELLALPEKVA